MIGFSILYTYSKLCLKTPILNYSKLLFSSKVNKSKSIMRVLNVAEKNDAAKHLSQILSNNASQRVSI